MASQQYSFGAGTLAATRTDVANSTPVNFAVLQDVEIDIDYTMKELYGQLQAPVDVARAAMKITGKAKTAIISSQLYNSLFFGANNIATSSILLFALAETHSVPAPSGPYTVTVTNSATWVADQGVFYTATGVQLTRVASVTAVGQYSVSAGVYTFYSGDASTSMSFNYDYTANSGGNLVSYTNQLMGAGPTFSVLLAESYNSQVMNVRIYAAKSSKLTLPLKNQDYTMSDFEFQAFAATGLTNASVIDITTTN